MTAREWDAWWVSDDRPRTLESEATRWRHARWLACIMIVALVPMRSVSAQRVASRLTAGDRDLVSLTFGNVTPASLAAAISLQSGSVRPVIHLGQPMLRVDERTSLLVHLPEVLPRDFTLEFDIVPKTCCMPEDLAVEGTLTIDQGTASANVLWHRDQIMVVGGAADNYHGKVPDALASAVPGRLTQVVLIVQGDNMTLQTNGQQLFALTNRKFARNNFLRVFLGGQNDTDRAVYLARLRVVANSPGPLAGGTAPARFVSVSSRSIAVAGFSATGTTFAVTSRTFSLAGFSAAGASPVASGTFPLAGLTATGVAGAIAPRTITLTGFVAAGTTAPIRSRTITLTGFSAAGTAASIASRTITLAGWTAAGRP